jgi:hypothetical protein
MAATSTPSAKRSEVRHTQWEIANSLFSYLKNGGVISGQVNEIITTCGVHANGYAVAKFLERAESMGHSPFRVRRKFESELSHRRLTYRISLKERYVKFVPVLPDRATQAV